LFVVKVKNRMKKLVVTLLAVLMLSGCSESDGDDCLKTITIPQVYFINNQSYTYDIEQEVPCDFEEPEEPVVIEAPTLENMTYEVLSFSFVPDTGNNTSLLSFEITLTNNNDFEAIGFPVVNLSADGIQNRVNFSNNDNNQCTSIQSNSSCTMTFSQESTLDLGVINELTLIDVEYFLIN